MYAEGKKGVLSEYWQVNLQMEGQYLKEISVNTRNWVHSGQGRDYWRELVNTALILRVP